MFDDQFFDFIYIDGYAHNGQKGVKHFASGLRKLNLVEFYVVTIMIKNSHLL